jgi:hypothetical protein
MKMTQMVVSRSSPIFRPNWRVCIQLVLSDRTIHEQIQFSRVFALGQVSRRKNSVFSDADIFIFSRFNVLAAHRALPDKSAAEINGTNSFNVFRSYENTGQDIGYIHVRFLRYSVVFAVTKSSDL